MADGLTLLEQHPLVESVETCVFDYGERQGVRVRLKPQNHPLERSWKAVKADTQDKAIAAMLNWLNEGKA